MEIRLVEHSIANNFGEYIEINKYLKEENPKLYGAILQHELEHSADKGFTKKDFILDLTEDRVSYKELLAFMIRHPKSLYQFLPLYRYSNKWFYDLNMIIVWGFVLVVIIVAAALSYL